MKRIHTLHKALPMLLTVVMVLNMGLTPMFAQSTPIDESGLAECHVVTHDNTCGYSETATIGGCNHTHGDYSFTEGIAEKLCTVVPIVDGVGTPDGHRAIPTMKIAATLRLPLVRLAITRTTTLAAMPKL